jgi:hypothetical protein
VFLNYLVFCVVGLFCLSSYYGLCLRFVLLVFVLRFVSKVYFVSLRTTFCV